MKTYHIHINGIVQGVGFRPLIYLLATEMQLSGYVKNGSDGVHVFFTASKEMADLFFEKIKEKAPKRSRIISSMLDESATAPFEDFQIISDDPDIQNKQVLMSPDNATCGECRRELYDVKDRRHRYPFITCTHCGPRYSIVNSLPYERVNTSMQAFTMCEKCRSEYYNVNDRRFFSQTNSCSDCGIELRITGNNKSLISNKTEEVLSHIKNLLAEGKIIAVKGIGGYLLLCDANNSKAIQLLRSRKHRRAKPFAVLYPNTDTVAANFELNNKEKILLENVEAPIVLLYPKQTANDNVSIHDIAPGLNRIGVMIPGNPLLELIATDFGKPLIATSANISGSPIIYKDEDALEYLLGIADYVVSHDRRIITPQDDSVVQVSRYTGEQIMLRRARGYAPSFLSYQPETNSSILATGAFLKSSFTLAIHGNTFISQFLGSGESYESQEMYRDTLEYWLNLYDAKPAVIICDLHPNYFSSQYAIELAEKYFVALELVKHHEAHFASVLAENDLIHSDESILGVIWDGTGLGHDKNIWGGEFFKYENKGMLRCYHFDYSPLIAGDKMALEPRISALCAASNTWPQSDKLKEKFTDAEWNNYQTLINDADIFTSSVGRIFDAAASLLGLCDKQSYEGEASMYLQALAEEYIEVNGFVMDASYFNDGSHYYRIPTASLIQGMLMDIDKGKAKNYIAAKFHYSLVCLIDIIAKNTQTKKLCFSGGVFQNALLVDWIKKEYSNKYELYFHKDLSPNDENISFGQMVYYDNKMKTIFVENTPKEIYHTEPIAEISN